jgi:hypothetical protein
MEVHTSFVTNFAHSLSIFFTLLQRLKHFYCQVNDIIGDINSFLHICGANQGPFI